MLIKPCEGYIEPLSELWHSVFGDSYEYISLFFKKAFYSADVFVKQTDGRIVSVLYLLDGTVSFEGKCYKGKYLYAAATACEYRGKGYMAELINEAKLYCENNGADFIALVPADEHLYSYYAKFGFKTAMHRYETKIRCSRNEENIFISIDADEAYFIRSSYSGNYFNFDFTAFRYAVDCASYFSSKFFRLSDGGYLLLSDDNSVVEELILSDNSTEDSLVEMLSQLNGELTVYSPYSFSYPGETVKAKFGMLYPIHKQLDRSWTYDDIYMNLALD